MKKLLFTSFIALSIFLFITILKNPSQFIPAASTRLLNLDYENLNALKQTMQEFISQEQECPRYVEKLFGYGILLKHNNHTEVTLKFLQIDIPDLFNYHEKDLVRILVNDSGFDPRLIKPLQDQTLCSERGKLILTLLKQMETAEYTETEKEDVLAFSHFYLVDQMQNAFLPKRILSFIEPICLYLKLNKDPSAMDECLVIQESVSEILLPQAAPDLKIDQYLYFLRATQRDLRERRNALLELLGEP